VTPSSHGYSNPRYSGNSQPPPQVTPTGLSPSMAERSSSLRLPRGGGIRLPHNTTSVPFYKGTFGLGSAPFPRRYSGHLFLISLPPPTEMLQFGGFPLLIGAPIKGGIAIRGSPDLSPHAAPRGLWQLATPFLGARAEPSTRRRSSNGQGSLAHQALIGISLALTRIPEICGIIRESWGVPFVGGDPAAGSPTATLLRLTPPRGAKARSQLFWSWDLAPAPLG
jgi:hypothetical protein